VPRPGRTEAATEFAVNRDAMAAAGTPFRRGRPDARPHVAQLHPPPRMSEAQSIMRVIHPARPACQMDRYGSTSALYTTSRSRAIRPSSVRFVAPKRRSSSRTALRAVSAEIPRAAPISLFVFPSATRRRIAR
jgi:hypothetical protein